MTDQAFRPAESDETAAGGRATVEPRHFRETLGHYPTGVAVVTAMTEEHGAVGMVVGSFTSVSLDPPLVAFMPQRDSGSFARLRQGTSFCVNVLSAEQEPLCRHIAAGGPSGLSSVPWTPAPSGAPILDGVVAWIDCAHESIVEAGDHYIVMGRVGAVEVVKPALPLLFFQGGYGRFSLPSLVASAEPDLVHGIRLAELARDEVEAVAEDLRAECSLMTPVGEDAVFVALASRSTEMSRVSLGFHVPLVPPVGSVFITTLGSVAVNAWLDRLPAADDDTRDTYIRQLERVRERGYSLSLRGGHSDRELYDVVRDYSALERLPEDERRFRALIKETAPLYEPDLEPDGAYDLHSIVVPIEGPLGLVQLALRLANLPRQASGRQVEEWVDRLKKAASVVSARIEDEHSAQFRSDGADDGADY